MRSKIAKTRECHRTSVEVGDGLLLGWAGLPEIATGPGPDAPRRPQSLTVVVVADAIRQWLKTQRGRGGFRQAESRLRIHVLEHRPELARTPVERVTKLQIRTMRTELRDEGYARHTIDNVTADLSAVFGLLIDDDRIARNPCQRRRADRDLPPNDHSWREEARFSRSEAEHILSADTLPLLHRAAWLPGFLGLREGEQVALRLRHYERTRPLHRLIVQTVYLTGEGRERQHTKTGTVRAHPILAGLQPLMDEWIGGGWAAAFGRHPGPDDLLFPWRTPSGECVHWRGDYLNDVFKRDLAQLGLRIRSARTRRRTWRSLALAAKVSKEIRDRITHARPSDAASLYDDLFWSETCAEILKFDLTYRHQAIQLPLLLGEVSTR